MDWSKWVDEDEEEEEGSKGLGGMDPSAMQSNYKFMKTLVALEDREALEEQEV